MKRKKSQVIKNIVSIITQTMLDNQYMIDHVLKIVD